LQSSPDSAPFRPQCRH